MDGNRFDDLVRNLATPTTRRKVFRSLIGGVAVAAGLSRHGALADCPQPSECSVDQECNLGGACLIGSCVGCTCQYSPVTDGASCNGGNLCTKGDTCQAGVCTSGAPIDCPPSSQCQLPGVCDPTTGLCVAANKPNGSACNDGNACTQGDICQGGICVGSSPVLCQPPDSCHTAGTCDPGTGLCSNPAVPDGTPCGDGNICNGNETCRGGVCPLAPPLPAIIADPVKINRHICLKSFFPRKPFGTQENI